MPPPTITIEAGIACNDNASVLLMTVWPSNGNAGISTGIEPVAIMIPFVALISICPVWVLTTTVFGEETMAVPCKHLNFVCLQKTGQTFSETGDDCVFSLLHFHPVGRDCR